MLKTSTDQQIDRHNATFSPLQVALAFLAFILIGINDGAFGVLIPSISAHYQINKATLSLLFLASTAGYFLESLNNGFLMAKLGIRSFLLLGLALLAVSMGTLALMPPFAVMLGLFLPIGFGVAILDAGLNSYIASLPRNGKLLNYLHAFYGTGALLGPFIASTLLALSFGWNIVYTLWATISTLLFVGVVWAFRTTATTKQDASEGQEGGNLLWNALQMRVVWFAALLLFFYVGTEVSTGSWSYSFLTQSRHIFPLVSGWMVSGYWLGLTLGRVTMAHLVQRLSEQRLISYCLLLSLASMLLLWLWPLPIISALSLCLFGFGLGPIFPTMIALISKLVSGRLLPSAVGLLTSTSSIGAAFFPWLAGNIAQRFNLTMLIPYVLLLLVVTLGCWLVLQRQA